MQLPQLATLDMGVSLPIFNGLREERRNKEIEERKFAIISVTSLPWPYRQMYSCIRQKGGRTSSKSPRR